LELAIAKKWQNIVLKPGLKESEHFLLVDEFVWQQIKEKFSVKNEHEIKRQGIIVNEETDECLVELYLKQLTIYPMPNSVHLPFKFDAPKTIIIGRRETVTSLEYKVRGLLSNELFRR
jgi:hypothetical protein